MFTARRYVSAADCALTVTTTIDDRRRPKTKDDNDGYERRMTSVARSKLFNDYHARPVCRESAVPWLLPVGRSAGRRRCPCRQKTLPAATRRPRTLPPARLRARHRHTLAVRPVGSRASSSSSADQCADTIVVFLFTTRRRPSH